MENKRKRIPLPVGVYIIFGLLVLRAFGQNIWYGSKPILQYTIVYNDLQYLRDWYYMDDIEKALVLLVSAFIIDNYIGKFILTLISEIALAISCILVTISCINILNWSRIKILYAHEEVLNIFEGIRYKIFEIIFFNQFIFPYHYFTWEKFLYFTNFLGNIMYMIFMYVSPLITEGVHCFGKNRCLSLTFSLTNIFDIISILIFIIEMHRIRKRKVERNIVVNMFKCIVTGIRGKIKFRKEKRHWLDYAVEKHGKALVERVKMVCGIFLITFSLLIFEIISSIFMNSFSMQINKMNRRFLGYNINVSNIFYFKVFVQVLVFPIIIILLPILRKHQIIYTPLQRIGAALILSMLSYFCATALSIHIDLNDDPLPTVGICQFRIYNNYNQDLDFMKTEFQDFTWHVNSMDIFSINVPVRRSRRINYTYEKNNIQKTVQFEFEEQKAIGYYFSESGELERFEDDVSKIHETYSAKVRVLANSGNIIYEIQDLQNESFYYGFSFNNSAQIVFPGTYNLSLDEQHAGTFEFLNGGIYAFLIYVENLSNVKTILSFHY